MVEHIAVELPIARARSFLFVPGHRPERFAKAMSSGADQIILDLEDAVGLGDKEEARVNVAVHLAKGHSAIVRINSHDSAYFANDIKALSEFPHVAICLPKAEPQALAALHYLTPKIPVLALIETVAGITQLEKIAQFGSVKRLAFGHLDFAADAGLPDQGLA